MADILILTFPLGPWPTAVEIAPANASKLLRRCIVTAAIQWSNVFVLTAEYLTESTIGEAENNS
jgi:hypothetical protein